MQKENKKMSAKQIRKKRKEALLHYEYALYCWKLQRPPFWRMFKRIKWRKNKPVRPRIIRKETAV